MKVYLDRNHCGVHQVACESCFGRRVEIDIGKIHGLDMNMAGCALEIIGDNITDK